MEHAQQNSATSKPSGQTILLASVVAASCVLLAYLLLLHDSTVASGAAQGGSRLTLASIPFDGARAYDFLNELCGLGPRISGTPAMQNQQRMLTKHFQKLGGKVRLQKFRIRHPATGRPVAMANLIVEWHPERRNRILLCTHYDTRPFPDQDRRDPRGTFLGANDGASGTALLMELGRQMASLDGAMGVDFVFFDAEEFVFEEGRDPYFVGSEYFATAYANEAQRPYQYRAAVLIDMVADTDLQIYPDRHTLSWDDSRPLVDAIWGTAKRLGVVEFVRDRRFDVLDDHIKLHDIARIPSCDIIDFKYKDWHTRADTPQSCSPLSLAKVGWVIQEWLKRAVVQDSAASVPGVSKK
jgi:glutaminyl-peptide cyclotransferase